ncbi:uncharacterized protein LOC131928717 isoform X2 [Physella acuta]|uniref:uncharacterized protein LOC131928717 isoform X2 n=1 Tax=Physella acuta TaxID=109671 RepID=UPI0027DC6C32|nr:uncharacterized protein LOC131928717 isoform X2 [Physella acuta]
MDCLTCMVMGMCMLCRPGFGASEPNRPMTHGEIASFYENMIDRIERQRVTPAPQVPYTRRETHRNDPRFTNMGIGKRQRSKIDHYNFALGIGKRVSGNDQRWNTIDDFYPNNIFDRKNQLSVSPDVIPDDENEDMARYSTNFKTLFKSPKSESGQEFYRDIKKVLQENSKILEESQKFYNVEKTKLDARRKAKEAQDLSTMLGFGS